MKNVINHNCTATGQYRYKLSTEPTGHCKTTTIEQDEKDH